MELFTVVGDDHSSSGDRARTGGDDLPIAVHVFFDDPIRTPGLLACMFKAFSPPGYTHT
ncbi:MAG: hypothetical protein AAFZ01_13005 [Pseudomonadota bacterium]